MIAYNEESSLRYSSHDRGRSKGSAPLHRQIYDRYRTAIVDGSLRRGQRIPSTRVLASELGVSRFPVLNAYAQLLAEGYVESRVGAGTVVSSLLPDDLTTSLPGRVRQVASRSRPRPICAAGYTCSNY